MNSDEFVLPDDVAACHAMIQTQQALIDQIQGTAGQQADTIASQQQMIEKLRHELDLFKRYLFGQRRERFIDDPRQGKLFEIDDDTHANDVAPVEEDPDSPEPPKPPRRGHGRRRLPDTLPRRRVVHELSEEERRCPCCDKLRVKVSEEISEQLEFQPATFHVIQHVRYI